MHVLAEAQIALNFAPCKFTVLPCKLHLNLRFCWITNWDLVYTAMTAFVSSRLS